MDPHFRKLYNEQFTQERYQWFQLELAKRLNCTFEFRLAETPLFLTDDFKSQAVKAANEIVARVAFQWQAIALRQIGIEEIGRAGERRDDSQRLRVRRRERDFARGDRDLARCASECCRHAGARGGTLGDRRHPLASELALKPVTASSSSRPWGFGK